MGDEIDFSSSDEGSDEHPVYGISTLAGLVVVQELKTQDSYLDFFNKNPVARHLEGSTDDAAEFPTGWFPMSAAELF